MKRKLTDNIPLKIMSLLVGFLVWLIVVNIDNPIVALSYLVTDVEVINEAYAEDDGKMVMLDEEGNSVRVYITAERKTLARITASDIKAVADLQQAVSLETDPVMVPITATCPGIPPGSIRVTPQNLSIHLEEMDTKEFMVSINREGKAGRGYEIGSQSVSPEKVKITGPKSLINKIDTVSVNVNVDGMTENRTEAATLSIVDKNQDKMSDSMNYLKIDNDGRVTVTTRLWRVRTDVKLSAGYVGEPEEGYAVDRVATVPETISVAGSDEALEVLRQEGNMIVIPDDSVDISGKSKDVESKIGLTEFLADNLKLVSGSSEDVLVRVSILPEGGHIYSIPTSDISMKSKPEDLQVVYGIDKIEVRVKPEESDLEGLSQEDIKASIDLEDMKEGSYEVPVEIKLPKGYELIDDVTIEVKISKISSAEENNG